MSIENHHLMNKTFHVDNGGYTFRLIGSVDSDPKNPNTKRTVYAQNLEITANHMDWIGTRITLGKMDVERLKEIGQAFLDAATSLEKLKENNKA